MTTIMNAHIHGATTSIILERHEMHKDVSGQVGMQINVINRVSAIVSLSPLGS